MQDPAPMTPAPSTASWPISEAPASLNIKLKIGNMELMFTMRDVDDLKLQRRATMSLPWLQDILHGCETNLAARQEAAERSRQQTEEERQAQARSLDEQIAAAVAAVSVACSSDEAGVRAPSRLAAVCACMAAWTAAAICSSRVRSGGIEGAAFALSSAC